MIQYIHCDECGDVYLVGIMGKCVDKKGSGGTLDGVPYVAFGNEELADAKEIVAGNLHKCPCCGRECNVQEGFPVVSR